MLGRDIEHGAIKRLGFDEPALLLQAKGVIETLNQVDHGKAPTGRRSLGKPRARKSAAEISDLKEVWRKWRQILPGRFRRRDGFTTRV
jgi:hypothetical protein